MAQQGRTITGMSGGTATSSTVVGQQKGPHHQVNNRDQRIEAKNIGGVATGDNITGPMTANVGQQKALDPTKATSKDVLKLLRQEECDDNTVSIFEKKRINGRMLLKLSQDELNQYRLTDEDEKNRVLGIIDDIKNGTLKLN
ncbi:uncharacterized protein LOC124291464 [Haliotis rubra]|uniref:uncharacterized protein LOC124291464 n=1 Tax=Haliotis rubra TaxID=36100 RepID=UPI001EE5705C|nr:uncharacterized protein LOC124291464 [Haliotis rubra]XP_046584409.1 uncharacterized protein LOC124291464 [Haliotis rubra]XP_046584410.1 uncharacterized protein LOC124291464 [Haliotis rubra]